MKFNLTISNDKKKTGKKQFINENERFNLAAITNYLNRVFSNYITISQLGDVKEKIEVYESLDIFFAATNRQSQLAKRINIKLFEKDSKGNKIEITEHPILDVLKKPNAFMTWGNFLDMYFGFYNTTGNVFIKESRLIQGVNGKPTGAVVALNILPSQHTEIIADTNYHFILAGYKLNLPSSNPLPISKEDVIHIKNPRLTYERNEDYFYGLSPIDPLMKNIRQLNGTKQTTISHLKNGGAKGMLTQDPAIWKNESSEGGISEEQASLIKEEIKKRYSGEFNAGDMLVTSASMKFLQLGSNLADLSVIDFEKWNNRAVLNCLHLDEGLFNMSDKSGLNQSDRDTANRSAYTNSVLPRMIDLIDALNESFVKSYADNLMLKIDVSDIPELQKNFKEMAETVSKIDEWLTPNEIREMFNKEPLENEDFNEPVYYLRQDQQGFNTLDNGK